jgi:hypothetical protein
MSSPQPGRREIFSSPSITTTIITITTMRGGITIIIITTITTKPNRSAGDQQDPFGSCFCRTGSDQG